MLSGTLLSQGVLMALIIIIILTITSTAMAYRDGAPNESCYSHEVNHPVFGIVGCGLPILCHEPCQWTLSDVVRKLGDENTQQAENCQSCSLYECGQTYLLHINYSVNSFEGFLVQARDDSEAFNESSSIYGTFLDDPLYLYKPLLCGINVNNQSQVFPNSAIHTRPVNEESHVPLYWRAPDPGDQLPESLTFWFTIVQQQQAFFFPIEGPTLVRENVSCNPRLSTTSEPTTPERVTDGITSVLFQIQLTGIFDCLQWTSNDTVYKNTIITTQLVLAVEQICECGFTRDHITEDAIQCFPESPQHFTFRARLCETPQASVSQLITHIEQWISNTDFITIQNVRLAVNKTCSLVIEDFNSPECPFSGFNLSTAATVAMKVTDSSDVDPSRDAAVKATIIGVLLLVIVCGMAVITVIIIS